MIRRASAWICSLALAACATLVPPLEPPRLTLEGVELRSGDLQRQQFALDLHATNPNPSAIAVAAVEVQVDLAGVPFAHGTSAAPFTLPAGGATDFTLDVTTDLATGLAAFAALQGHRAIDYRVYGQLRLQHGWLRTLPFDQTGRVRR